MKSGIYILCLALGLMLGACGKKTDGNYATEVRVKTVVMTDTSRVDNSEYNKLVRTYMGMVEEVSNASLSFTFGGQVMKVYVSEGDHVTKGQRLISVDDTEAQASLSAAKAQFEQARDAYDRVKTVYDKGGVSEVKWVDVQTKLAQARSVYELANQNVSNRVLTAPFSGVIGEINAVVGDNLLPGQPVVKVIDVNNLCVTFYVPEAEIRLLSVGDQVEVDCGSIGKCFKAVVQDKSLVANRVTHSYKVRLQVEKPDSELLPGMNCKVHVVQNNLKGYVIPGRAVQTYQDGLYCWVVKDGCAQRVPVKSSAFVNNGVVISSGITKGDIVVVSGYQKLYNGVRVVTE